MTTLSQTTTGAGFWAGTLAGINQFAVFSFDPLRTVVVARTTEQSVIDKASKNSSYFSQVPGGTLLLGREMRTPYSTVASSLGSILRVNNNSSRDTTLIISGEQIRESTNPFDPAEKLEATAVTGAIIGFWSAVASFVPHEVIFAAQRESSFYLYINLLRSLFEPYRSFGIEVPATHPAPINADAAREEVVAAAMQRVRELKAIIAESHRVKREHSGTDGQLASMLDRLDTGWDSKRDDFNGEKEHIVMASLALEGNLFLEYNRLEDFIRRAESASTILTKWTAAQYLSQELEKHFPRFRDHTKLISGRLQ